MRKLQILILLFLFVALDLFSQQTKSACKVLIETISKTYDGQCKDGLAHGKGTATGTDFYVGMFKKGLPHGNGKYTFNNGNSYDGLWVNGLKNGKGEFKYFVNGTPTILTGYWQDDEYIGEIKPKEPSVKDNTDDSYRLIKLSGIEYFSINKLESDEHRIEISFERIFNTYIPKDLEVTSSTGYLTQINKKLIIHDYACPLVCTIYFRIKIGGHYRQCYFDFDILEPGKYEVFISNN